MEHKIIISALVLIPFIGFLISLLPDKKREKVLSRMAFYTVSVQLAAVLGYICYWLVQANGKPVNVSEFSLYHKGDYSFLIDFYFDRVTAVYLAVGAFVTFLITRYSRYYLHLEEGYKRFFNSILFFFLAYNMTVLAGNFETLFIGWEMLGISSFLLIAFYRDRYLPVRNAVKVFSIYRIGDIGIILAMWASHHLWHENITFLKLNNADLVVSQLTTHGGIGLFIALGILMAAAAKSAQLPFSSWLPRAMEGPTPSSAIFYGSLSVHFGVFLLLRTAHFWEHQWIARLMIGMLGLATTLVAYPIARVQSTIKSQIAYASIAQIGLMFVEVAAGFHGLALIHFAGNAFLRTYQLLVSPSVVSYMIRDQFYHYQPKEHTLEDGFPKKLEYSLYLLSLQEWKLDKLMKSLVFSPIKKLGGNLDFLTPKNLVMLFTPAYAIGLYLYLHQQLIPAQIASLLPAALTLIGMLMVFKAFSERNYPRLAWLLVTANHFWIALAVSFNETFDFSQTAIYLSGVSVFSISGLLALERLRRQEGSHYDLNMYYGHVYEHPRSALIFLVSTLGLMAFPISPTFVGVDLLFSHIHEDQYLLAAMYSISFIIGGIALIRIYARLYLGPHIKTYHPTALKSS
jgi:NADH-quinone oxidoreductase subunit L